MANTHLAYPYLAIDKFSGTNPNQDAESFIQLIERKINCAHGDSPGDAGELANYSFRKETLCYSLLRGLAAEWYENNITNATTWENVRRNFKFQIFVWAKQILIPTGSGTLYQRRWRRNSELPASHQGKCGWRVARQYGRNCPSRPRCWKNCSGPAKKTKTHQLLNETTWT